MIEGEYGNSSSIGLMVILSKTYSRYFETFKSLIFAVLMIENSFVVYLAPA